jgi:5-methylcytosine-specific restriction endonuclease McrA
MTVDAKPAKRIRDRTLVANFAARASSCAVCGQGRSGAVLDPHHVYPKGRGGDDVTANLVALCRTCHDDVELYRGDARQKLGLHLMEKRPDVLWYLTGKLGSGQSREFMRRSYG